MYADVLTDLFRRYESDREQRQSTIKQQVEKNNKRIEKAMDMMMENQIDTDDYKLIKSRYERENQKLMRDKAILNDIGSNGKYLKGCVAYLKNLDQIYFKASTPLKKIMVGSILEEKLIYDKTAFRTPKYTPVVEYITMKNNELEGEKSGMLKKSSSIPAG